MSVYVPPDLRKAVEDAFTNLACGDPISSVDSNLNDGQLEAMLGEAQTIPQLLFRGVQDATSPWINTTRATFFPRNNTNWPAHALGRMILPRAEKWLPHSYRFSQHLSGLVKLVANQNTVANNIHSLRSWTPNRLGLNYMDGTPSDPAEIKEHTDPVEEVGLVAALELLGNAAGRLTFIFSADTCRNLKLPQPPHSVISEEPRLSLTLAELHRPTLPRALADL